MLTKEEIISNGEAVCKNPVAENATFISKITTEGNTISGKCNEGFTGTVTAKCMDDESWNIVNNCSKNCSNLNNIYDGVNFETLITSIVNGQTGYSKCDNGYLGYRENLCNEGKLETSDYCTKITNYCSILSSISNGSINYSDNDLTLNSTATLSCNTGYILSGNSTTTCFSDNETNGKWGSELGECTFDFQNYCNTSTIKTDIENIFNILDENQIEENLAIKMNNTLFKTAISCKNGYTGTINLLCNDKLKWVADSNCAKLVQMNKCWSASGGKANTIDNASTQSNANIDTSYSGFIDTDCCSGTGNKYVDLDLKLQRALCEKETEIYNCTLENLTNIYTFNEDTYNINWGNKTKEEKLIKYTTLSGINIDLRCLNLSKINMSNYINNFNSAIDGKNVYFAYRPAKNNTTSTLNDGANLSYANFSNVVFNKYLHFGTNYYSSGNPGTNLTNAIFKNSTFIGEVRYGYNYESTGDAGSNLTYANFSGSTFNNYAYFGYNYNSKGNPGSNLKNANFSGTTFNEVRFAYNYSSSSGHPGSNLTNSDFTNSTFNGLVAFGRSYSYGGYSGTNVNGAKFSGAIFNSSIYVPNTNFCKIYSFDNNGKLSTSCATGTNGTVPESVYNPYCYFNSTSCEGWNGTR